MLLAPPRRPAVALAASLVALGVLLVAACGTDDPTPECLAPDDGSLVPAECDVEGQPTATPTPTPAPVDTPSPLSPGAQLIVGSGCGGCHTIDGVSVGRLGPDLSHIGGRADATYIRQSILDPDAAMAEACPSGPCPPGVMPQSFGEDLTGAQIDTLVDYLVSLK